MNNVLIAYAPYVSLIIGALVSLVTFMESKRKTRHDELHDLYDEVKSDNDKIRKERDRYHEKWLASEKKIDELEEENDETK